MSFEVVFKALSDIAMADTSSYWIVATLTFLVVLVMRAMLPVKGLAFVFAPAIFWGGLSGIYAMREAGLVIATEPAANDVATATLGMIVAVVIMLLLVRLAGALVRISKPLSYSTNGETAAPRRVRI